MYVKEVLVQNKAGLHARPATFFIQKANEYKSTVNTFQSDGIMGDLIAQTITKCNCCREPVQPSRLLLTVQTKQRLLMALLLSLSQVLLNKLNNLYSFRI